MKRWLWVPLLLIALSFDTSIRAQEPMTWNEFQTWYAARGTPDPPLRWSAGLHHQTKAAVAYHQYLRTFDSGRTIVLGLQPDIELFNPRGVELIGPDYMALQTPYWNPRINYAWLEGGAARGASFDLLTDLNKLNAIMRQPPSDPALGRLTTLGKEVMFLKYDRNYYQWGQRLVPYSPDLPAEVLRTGKRVPLPVIELPEVAKIATESVEVTRGVEVTAEVTEGLRGVEVLRSAETMRGLAEVAETGASVARRGNLVLLAGDAALRGLVWVADVTDPGNRPGGQTTKQRWAQEAAARESYEKFVVPMERRLRVQRQKQWEDFEAARNHYEAFIAAKKAPTAILFYPDMPGAKIHGYAYKGSYYSILSGKELGPISKFKADDIAVVPNPLLKP
jgi:hypothetical protein